MRNLLSIFSFKNRNPFTAIWLFLVLVVALETVFAFLPENSLITALRMSRIPDPTPDIQIMGDSVARDGLRAEHFKPFVPDGTIVHNAAMAGTGPEFSYFLLKRQIDAGKAPKTIIYAPSPHTFASKRVALLIGGFCDWNEVIEVSSSRQEPFEVIYGVFCKLSHTLRNREQISDILKGDAPLFAETPKNEDRDPATVAAKRSYPIEKLNSMYRKPFEVHAFNRYYYEKFLKLAQQQGIPVYWVNMPILSAVAESRKKVNFEAAYDTFLDETQTNFGVKVLQKEFLVFEDGAFKDYTHLDLPGAERFTKLVGEKLQALPINPRSQTASQ